MDGAGCLAIYVRFVTLAVLPVSASFTRTDKLMEELNRTLFLNLNAHADASPLVLLFAKIMAEYAILLVPVILVLGWCGRSERHHRLMLSAFLATLAGLAINGLIGLLWDHPRPFVMPLGHTFIPHAPTPSFPSNHMTIVSTVAFSFLLRPHLRAIGLALAVLALPIAWSRIYLGVHFPLDMLGAVVVAAISATLVRLLQPLFMTPLYRLLRRLYRWLFAPLIQLGWVSK